MSRSSSELKRISRDILNNRYSVPMAAFLTASLIPTLIEIPFSMTLGDYPGTPQLIISTIADILILLIAQMLDTGVMLVHMNMTRGQTYRIRDVFTPFLLSRCRSLRCISGDRRYSCHCRCSLFL